VTRQRPVAGQRNRSRLGSGPAVEQEQVVASSRRTAVLDREVTPADLPSAPAGEPPVRRSGRGTRGTRGDLLVLVAALVTVALALTAGLLALRARGEDRVEHARTAALAAAESHAVVLLSYDHRHLDRDFARAAKVLTGSFADDYAHTTESVVRPTAEDVKAVVTADVAASSVIRASQNRVVVLLFVNQTTTSTRLEGPKVDLNRVQMRLDRVDGQWLVSKVVAL
jgi:Mce-associated membrane protein